MIENELPQATREDIENNDSISFVYGGANTDSADIGKDYTARLLRPYLKGSAVIPLAREWTNAGIDSEFEGDMKQVLKMVLSNPLFKQGFSDFLGGETFSGVSETQRKDLLADLEIDNLNLENFDQLYELFSQLLNNKDFSLGKALQATFKGYNPDDVLGAAEVISLMEQFPDKLVQILGFSHGGYNALGTVDLLNRMGYTNVKGASIGTPITGLNSTVNPDNFMAFMGDKDYYYNAIEPLTEDIDFPEFFDVGEGEGALHALQNYLRGSEFKGRLQQFLAGRVKLPKDSEFGKYDSKFLYASGELGAETAIIRTLMNYLGEKQLGNINADEGFIFSAEESLPGYKGNLQKMQKKLKNEDVKAFAQLYLDFLETLQQELELAERLAEIGVEYKPAQSLQKAAKIFPELESLALKYQDSGLSDEELATANEQLSEQEQLVFFKRKVKQQKDNIERTFQAMLGYKFSKKDEDKGIYSFYNAKDYEQRAEGFGGMIDWLENQILGDVPESQKEEAKPLLDLLFKIKEQINAVGSTGELDLSVVREAQELLGLDLREFEPLFKQLESNDVDTVDVDRYKDTLKVLRQSRDQIIKESKQPKKIDREVEKIDRELKNTDRELLKAYSKHLKSIVSSSAKAARKTIDEGRDSISNEDAEAAYSSIRKKVENYRKAVIESNFALAMDLGEQLLDETEYFKQLFNQSDSSSIKNKTGQLTRIQNEVLRGDKGSGRIDVPLSEIALQPGVRQLSIDFEVIGRDVQHRQPKLG